MEGDDNGKSGNGGGVDKERDEAGAFGEVWSDIKINCFFDDFVPGEGRHKTKT